MLTIIVAGRNDDYGQDFRQRLFRTAHHNSTLLTEAKLDFEYILAEWNPLPDRPLLSEEFVARVPHARTVVIPSEIHQAYTLNPNMPFHEMPAKNAALRRAKGDVVIVTNADVLFSNALINRIASDTWSDGALYRAHRIDVKPDLTWEEMQNPANQLSSGEGRLCPPYYLGAGGDFCLAKRHVWDSLRGFNEHIRFSTRAKDWQFFLSAAARSLNIEFIGDVYHLDHDGGFRNTSTAKLNTDAVHFGRWWDIEFGLPAANPSHWGFSNLREKQFKRDPRIAILDAADYFTSEVDDRRDREIMAWLTRPPALPDVHIAFLLHSICAAHREQRRLICRVTNVQLLVSLYGLQAVASRFGVDIRCNTNLPQVPGFTARQFTSEPARLQTGDWLLEETEWGLRVREFETDLKIDVLPKVQKMDEPEFDPVLVRRLLRAYLKLQSDGVRDIAIYGAGSHTKNLLKWGVPDSLRVKSILQTLPDTLDVDTILLSSASFESDMLQECKLRQVPNVISLYTDWPRDMWAVGVPV
jgi:hypothetical protein